MKKDELLKKLKKISNDLAFDREKSEDIAKYCLENYDLPVSHFMDLISDRVSFQDEKIEVLYFVSKGIDHVMFSDLCEKYFDEKEREALRFKKFIISGFDYPFTIPCIEIESNRQWIGAISAKDLMRLREADMIRYNKNKQRIRKKVMADGQTTFKISIAQSAVNQIANLMDKGEYIPDDITLDIPDDVTTEFKYDFDKKEIIFNYIDKLDITDGYHRYLAICKNYDKNPDFDYQMEIRITQFSIPRTQQFIYQKDQKTKMSTTQSKSYNINRPSNEVINRINERGSGLLLAGQIGRSDGTVDYMALSDIVEYYWFKGRKEEVSNKEISDVGNQVKTLLNGIVNNDPEYFEKYLDFKKLVTYFWLVLDKKKDYQEAISLVNKAVETGEIKKIKLREIRNRLFEELESMDI